MYGGTKSEMERLLADAEKLSGKKYDISNLGDVYEAIHVIQKELGLTGVAADEASTTLTGSMGAVKASFENVLANLSLGEDIRPSLEALMTSVSTFLTDNLFPMIKNIFQGLPTVLEGIGEFFIQAFSGIAQNADSFIQTGIEIATALINSIVTAIPNLAANFLEMVLAIGQAIINTDWTVIATNIIQNLVNSLTAAGNTLFGEGFNLIEIINNAVTVQLPQLLSKGTEIIQTIINGIVQNLPSLLSTGAQIISQIRTSIISAETQLFSSASDIIKAILDGITQVLPSLLSAGVEILTSIANGILQNLPTMITTAIEIVNSLITFITENLPLIIQMGMELLTNLCQGIQDNLPAIVEAALTAITTLLNTITEKLPDILQMGVDHLLELIAGIIKSLPDIVKTAAEVIAKLIFELTSHLPEILKMGMNLLGELIAGIIKQIPELIKAIPKVISGITDTFSKFDWQSVGSNLLEGIKNGIVNNVGKIVEAARNAAKAAFDAAKKFLGINSPSTEGTWLGEMYGLGVEKGIENKIIDIKKASLGIGQAAIDSVSDIPDVANDINLEGKVGTSGKVYQITINVYASENQSEEELAKEISYQLADEIERDEVVYA
jgi:phage-related protein